MTCKNTEMARKVVLYQELSADAREAVDAHVALCADCASDLEVIRDFAAHLSRMGKKRKETLVHPPEEAIIQYAVDSRLLAHGPASQVKKHLQEDRCVECKRLYWEILDSEKQAAAQPWMQGQEENRAAKFWKKYILAFRSPILAKAVMFLFLSFSVWTLVRNKDLNQQLWQKEKQMADLRAEQATLKQEYEKQRSLSERMNQVEEQYLSLADKLKRLSEPSIGFSYPISITEDTRGGEQKAARIVFPKRAEILSLPIRVTEEYRLCVVELYDETNRLIWHGEIEPNENHTLPLTIPKDFLKKNTYKLKVSGKTKQGVKLIEEIPLQITIRK